MGIQSMAGQRGNNWALPKSLPQSTPVTRTLHMLCAADRMTLLPDANTSRSVTIEFTPDLQADATKLAVAIQKHMENWGLAVAGGYWKPTLQVEVIPGGETRFEILQALMSGSGVELQRRNAQ